MRIDWSPETGSLDLGTLSRLYAAKMLKPSDVVRAVYQRLDRHDHVWISRVPLGDAVARAEEIERKGPALPLYGIPFAVKDNIDVDGMPTTAACKEFARRPPKSATVVDQLFRRAPSLSARPTWTSSPRDWSASGRRMGRSAIRSTRATSPAARAQAPPWRSLRAWSVLRWARTPRVPVACPRHSTTSLA